MRFKCGSVKYQANAANFPAVDIEQLHHGCLHARLGEFVNKAYTVIVAERLDDAVFHVARRILLKGLDIAVGRTELVHWPLERQVPVHQFAQQFRVVFVVKRIKEFKGDFQRLHGHINNRAGKQNKALC